MSAALKPIIVGLVSGIEPTDDLGREHRRNALSWLAGTDDIFRREKPPTPSPHLVSYFLLVDRAAGSVLLCDHRLSGLWLPTGGHVEPGEHPLSTVRREAVEELSVTAQLDAAFRDRPFFLTMTETVGPPTTRHVDVSLWFALAGRVGQPPVSGPARIRPGQLADRPGSPGSRGEQLPLPRPACVRPQQPPQPGPHADQRFPVQEPLEILPLGLSKEQGIQRQTLAAVLHVTYTRRPDQATCSGSSTFPAAGPFRSSREHGRRRAYSLQRGGKLPVSIMPIIPVPTSPGHRHAAHCRYPHLRTSTGQRQPARMLRPATQGRIGPYHMHRSRMVRGSGNGLEAASPLRPQPSRGCGDPVRAR